LKYFATLALCLMPFAAPNMAAAQDTSMSLAEAMKGASAMTTLANAFIFITSDAGEYVCALELQSNYFASLAKGDPAKAEETQPGSICVPATEFKNLGVK
jgi:hypothetical protein